MDIISQQSKNVSNSIKESVTIHKPLFLGISYNNEKTISTTQTSTINTIKITEISIIISKIKKIIHQTISNAIEKACKYAAIVIFAISKSNHTTEMSTNIAIKKSINAT